MTLDLTQLAGHERAKLARERWSPYMRAKYENDAGGKRTLVCPFGCGMEQHDTNNNCRHLIGYTKDKKKYEPLVRLPNGRRVVRCRMRPVSGDVKSRKCAKCERRIWTIHEEGNVVCAPCGERLREDDPAYTIQEEVVMEPVLESVKGDDTLIQITDSWRVYRSDERQKETAKKFKNPREAGLELVEEEPQEAAKE